MQNKKVLIIIIFIIISILLGINTLKKMREPEVLTLKLYFYNPQENSFILYTKEVKSPPSHLPELALQELLQTPPPSNLISPFPEGTKVLGFKIKDKTAICNFNENLISYGGGSTMEIALVGSLVLTLTEFPNIDKVQILIEDAKHKYLPQGTEIEQPLERDNWEKMVKD